MLAGGLSCSVYVFDAFQNFIDETFGKKDKDKVELISCLKPWSAIARGAVIHALEKPVMYRRSRDHIGLCVHEKFVPRKHSINDRFECPLRGSRAANQMAWSVAKVTDRGF